MVARAAPPPDQCAQRAPSPPPYLGRIKRRTTNLYHAVAGLFRSGLPGADDARAGDAAGAGSGYVGCRWHVRPPQPQAGPPLAAAAARERFSVGLPFSSLAAAGWPVGVCGV